MPLVTDAPGWIISTVAFCPGVPVSKIADTCPLYSTPATRRGTKGKGPKSTVGSPVGGLTFGCGRLARRSGAIKLNAGGFTYFGIRNESKGSGRNLAALTLGLIGASAIFAVAVSVPPAGAPGAVGAPGAPPPPNGKPVGAPSKDDATLGGPAGLPACAGLAPAGAAGVADGAPPGAAGADDGRLETGRRRLSRQRYERRECRGCAGRREEGGESQRQHAPDVGVRRYRFTKQARADLHDIFLYGYEQFGETQAEAYAAGLDHVFQLLADNPQMGRKAEAMSPHGRTG